MLSSNPSLIKALETQAIEGIYNKPEKTLETLLSKLFFYPETVCKVYKYDKNFIGDFGAFGFRKDFYEEDFAWNNKMSPLIYTALRYVRFDGNKYINTDKGQAKDCYIEMKRIDGTKNLTNLLEQNSVTAEEIIRVGGEMMQKIQKLTKDKIGQYQDMANFGLEKIYLGVMESLRSFGHMAKDYIPTSRIDEIVDSLIKAIQNEPYFKNFDIKNFSLNIDNQSDNIIIQNGKIEYIDIFPPLKIWRIHDPFFVISRGALDVSVLKDEKHADLMHQEYSKYYPLGPDLVRKHYELYGALIRASYFFILKRPEIAKKYLDFVDKNILLFQ